jgi:DNA polymerase III psi subunit
MTQRSATAEIVVEIVDSHLNGRNLVLVQEVKKLAALKTQRFCCLALRKFAFLKPTQHCRDQRLARDIIAEALRELSRQVHDNLAGHF